MGSRANTAGRSEMLGGGGKCKILLSPDLQQLPRTMRSKLLKGDEGVLSLCRARGRKVSSEEAEAETETETKSG